MPKISIIVPVYKVEKYITQCLDSIITQTFSDWECILIDDGSPDNSGKICDEYATKDSRLIVIHQENAGVSAARNSGLDIAKGEYITFIDSDDWVEPDYLTTLYDILLEKKCDIVIVGIRKIINLSKKKEILPKRGFLDIPNDLIHISNGVLAKLYKKELILKNKILFPTNIVIAEDLLFNFNLFLCTDKIYGVDKALYNYVNNPSSCINNISEKKIYEEKKVIDTIETKLFAINANISWFNWLIEKKIICKNKCLFKLSKPNVELWNTIYCDCTEIIINKAKGIKKIFYICARERYDFFLQIFFYCLKIRNKLKK